MAIVDWVKADQADKEPDVSFRKPVPQEIVLALQEVFQPIQGLKEAPDFFFINFLLGGKTSLVDPIVDMVVDFLVDPVNVLPQFRGIKIQLILRQVIKGRI